MSKYFVMVEFSRNIHFGPFLGQSILCTEASLNFLPQLNPGYQIRFFLSSQKVSKIGQEVKALIFLKAICVRKLGTQGSFAQHSFF